MSSGRLSGKIRNGLKDEKDYIVGSTLHDLLSDVKLDFLNFNLKCKPPAFRFDFYTDLQTKLQSPAKVIPVFDNVQMHGEKGAVATVAMPAGM